MFRDEDVPSGAGKRSEFVWLGSMGSEALFVQAYLGHRNIQHTVRYTELLQTRFRISGESERAAENWLQSRYPHLALARRMRWPHEAAKIVPRLGLLRSSEI